MCEPSHSIIQYRDPEDPVDRDDDDFHGGSAQGNYRISRLVEGLGKWSKRIKSWFHLSMMGHGHSETIGARASNMAMMDYHSLLGLYEAHWWNRNVVPDGYMAKWEGVEYDCAKQYAQSVSIGNLTALRSFLEKSIGASSRPTVYVSTFRDRFLNNEGRVKFDAKFKACFKNKLTLANILKQSRDDQSGLTKFVLGFTRKRNLIVPEWSDDKKLWVPGT